MGMENIEHVVVLMLENRSFDSLLGWLYEHDAPTLNIPEAIRGDEFRGLSDLNLKEFINTADNGLSSPPVRGAQGFSVPSVAPGEEFEHVNMQLFGSKNPGPGDVATMTGVLQDFVNVMRIKKYKDEDIQKTAPTIMQTYTQQQLPVLSQLARHYAVCDAWFASVPSQTNPNRAFLLTGTSHGLVNNGQLETDDRGKLFAGLGLAIGDDRFPEDTIFNALNTAGHDWAVFWQTSYLPQKIANLASAVSMLRDLFKLLPPGEADGLRALVEWLGKYSDYIGELTNGRVASTYTRRLFQQSLEKIDGVDQCFKTLDQFHKLARLGQLPKFSYIEPIWTISHDATNDGAIAQVQNLVTQIGNDYHPPGNMIIAENFVKDVYASLIANQDAWNKTLLLITFDEFVGSFDHVAPPTALSPWETPPDFSTNGFDFKRYGARVPTILVSPWIRKSTVFRSTTDVPFDHTSVIATTLKWLGQDSQLTSFGQRASSAPTFENALTLKQPRTDAGDVGFLNVARKIGDPVKFGDLILLRNGKNRYVSTASRAMKIGPNLPDSLMAFAVDLNLAAYFPTIGNNTKATLSFQASQASQLDDSSQVQDGALLFIVTQESDVDADIFLGAWKDSHDCYYFKNYVQGNYARSEGWLVKQMDPNRVGQPLCYGDRIYIETNSDSYKGQRLTQDTRIGQGQWITTVKPGNGEDCWTVVPAITDGL